MNINGKWYTETEASVYMAELEKHVSTLENLNDRLLEANDKLEKQLEAVQTAKGIDDMQIAHYENDWKNTIGAKAVNEIERLRTENRRIKEQIEQLIKKYE